MNALTAALEEYADPRNWTRTPEGSARAADALDKERDTNGAGAGGGL